MSDRPKILVLGAHPDDAEYSAGGLATLARAAGHQVKFVSVTDGAAGHHQRTPDELREIRRAEAAAAGAVLGVHYEVWNNPDGHLLPSLEVRSQVIREIRTFAPDLVLTHRTCDYHPDHRAVAQAVQDASYLVTVPLVVPEVPALRRDPVVAYLPDLFTQPCPLRADVALDITDCLEAIVSALCCHESQVFEWLPYNEQILHLVPAGQIARRNWLRQWYIDRIRGRAERFRAALIEQYGTARGQAIELAEAYEISEYASPLTPEARQRLFPFLAGFAGGEH